LSLKLEIVNRFLPKIGGSFFLFGPRGTGKSTWISLAFPEALVINLLEPDVFRRFAARPETLLDLVRGLPLAKTIVIDEVQKIPGLLDAVHQLMEEKRGHQFVLTGSSARKLKRTGTDLLAGRAALKTMHPFIAAELGPKFSLERALKTGTLPVIFSSADPEEALKSYVALYLKEEVQLEGFVRKIGDFARFLEIASFSHASSLNVSNISRECEVERKTVEGYIGILEDLLIATKIPIFKKRAKRQVSEHPKFYLFDAGVFQTLRPRGPLDRPQDIEGQALEGLVAQHLRAWMAYGTKAYDLFYWRTRSGVEVDFIVYGADGFWAIEIKNARRVWPDDLRSLRAFGEDFPESRRIFLYRGRERLSLDGVICFPCQEFFTRLQPDKPLPE
jgi:predicted AAA+ superfamily ATPase